MSAAFFPNYVVPNHVYWERGGVYSYFVGIYILINFWSFPPPSYIRLSISLFRDPNTVLRNHHLVKGGCSDILFLADFLQGRTIFEALLEFFEIFEYRGVKLSSIINTGGARTIKNLKLLKTNYIKTLQYCWHVALSAGLSYRGKGFFVDGFRPRAETSFIVCSKSDITSVTDKVTFWHTKKTPSPDNFLRFATKKKPRFCSACGFINPDPDSIWIGPSWLA